MSYLLNYIWGDSNEIFEFIYQTAGNPTDITETNKNLDKLNIDTIVTLKFNNQNLKVLPEFIQKSQNLTTLTIEDSKIDIFDFKIFKKIEKLKKIIIINCNITKTIDSENYDDLKIQYIIINQSPNIHIESISKIKTIKELYYINNVIDSVCDLSELKELTILDLHNNKINSIDEIGRLENVISLNLGTNNIKNIAALSNCKNLKYIYINKNEIESISEFEELTNIRYFIANSNKIKHINVISNFENLEVLHLDENPIKKIPNLLKLKNIKFDDLHIDWKIVDDVDDMKGFKLIKNIILNLNKK